MNQSQSGETGLSASQRLESVQRQIDDYQKRIGCLPIKTKNEAEEFLNMTRAEMKQLTWEECAEAGVVLMQYATFLQEAYNKELGKASWADAEIKRKIAKSINQYKGPSYEERKNAAIQGDEYTASLDKLHAWAQSIAERISFMANRADAVARAYMSLAQAKRKQ
jgi:hypothetical protein